MNRASIAAVERDPVTGDWTWMPKPKIAALGLRPVRARSVARIDKQARRVAKLTADARVRPPHPVDVT
jgi:hypothetical protein